jgi:hypothetical protein
MNKKLIILGLVALMVPVIVFTGCKVSIPRDSGGLPIELWMKVYQKGIE